MRYAMLCVAAFCLALALAWAWRLSPPYRGRELAATLVDVPSAKDFRLSYYGDHLDHVWLYHGLSPTAMQSLKAADIVIAGSSLAAFAFLQKDLQAHLGARGWSFFQMAFAADGAPAALDMIRRHNLHPHVLIVMDDRFFKPPSRYWERTRSFSQFDAVKFCWDAMTDFTVKRYFHRFVPAVRNLALNSLLMGEDYVIFRSLRDGTWRAAPKEGSFHQAGSFQPEPYDEAVFAAARDFMEEMNRRDIAVLFTWAPNPLSRADDSAGLARACDIPWMTPDVSDLPTYDGYHMTPEGAARFSDLFFRKVVPWLETHLGR